MRRIAIINQKGGVGKTTTTANLAAALAQAGKKTFLIDLDPQGHLGLHFGLNVQPDQATVYDVLTASTPIAEAKVSVRENIDVLPADIDLAAAEAELVSVTGREVLLREAVDAFGNGYDAMLVDCAPSLGVLTINALAACTEVVIPLQAHFFGLQGLSKLLETVMLVRQRINPHLKVSGIALCMHEASTRLATEIAEDLTKFLQAARGSNKPWADALLYQTAIRRNIKLAESSSFGQTVFDYAPRSNGAVDYVNLAAEIFPDLPKPVAVAEESGAAEPIVTKTRAAVLREVPAKGVAEAAQPAPEPPVVIDPPVVVTPPVATNPSVIITPPVVTNPPVVSDRSGIGNPPVITNLPVQAPSQISKLKSQISNLKSEISNPQSRIASAKSEVSSPKSAISNAPAISDPQSEISNPKSRIASAQSEVSSLKSEISNFKSEIPDIESAAANLQSQGTNRRSEPSNRKPPKPVPAPRPGRSSAASGSSLIASPAAKAIAASTASTAEKNGGDGKQREPLAAVLPSAKPPATARSLARTKADPLASPASTRIPRGAGTTKLPPPPPADNTPAPISSRAPTPEASGAHNKPINVRPSARVLAKIKKKAVPVQPAPILGAKPKSEPSKAAAPLAGKAKSAQSEPSSVVTSGSLPAAACVNASPEAPLSPAHRPAATPVVARKPAPAVVAPKPTPTSVVAQKPTPASVVAYKPAATSVVAPKPAATPVIAEKPAEKSMRRRSLPDTAGAASNSMHEQAVSQQAEVAGV